MVTEVLLTIISFLILHNIKGPSIGYHTFEFRGNSDGPNSLLWYVNAAVSDSTSTTDSSWLANLFGYLVQFINYQHVWLWHRCWGVRLPRRHGMRESRWERERSP